MNYSIDPFVEATNEQSFVPLTEQPSFNIADAEPIANATYIGYVYVPEDVTNATLKVGADDNATAFLYAFESLRARVDPLPNAQYGGGQFRYSEEVVLAATLPKGYYRMQVTYTNVVLPESWQNIARLEVLLNGTQVQLGNLKCKVDFPENAIQLAHPITWYEKRQDAASVQYKYNTGTITHLTAAEYNAMVRVIFAESSNHVDQDDEMRAIASVMLNRLGNSITLQYRDPVTSMLSEDEFPNPSNWPSYGGTQYNQVAEAKYCDVNQETCKKLNKAKAALDYVIANGVSVVYDGFRQGGTTNQPHVNIGGTSFLTTIQRRDCRTEPDNWENLPVWSGSPLDI